MSTNFTTSQLIECYPHGYPGLSPDWNLQATMGLTIPLSQFSKSPRSFSDLNPTSPFHPVLESLFQVLDRQYIKGTVFQNSQNAIFPYHCAEGVPKYVVATEVLVKKMENENEPMKDFEKNNLWGYRVWVLRIDPSLNLKESYDEFARSPKKPDCVSPLLKSIDSQYNMEQKVWKPFSSYYSHILRGMSGADDFSTDNTMISDPEEMLTPERMFDKNFMNGLCPEQSEYFKYFNLTQGPSAFNGSFPFRNFMFRISHDYVNETFYRPIPNSLFLSVSENQKKIRQLQIQLKDQKILLENNNLSEEALKEIQHIEKSIQNYEDDNVRILRTISNNNPGTGTYISSDSVHEKLAETNELLKIRRENERTFVNLRQSYDLDDPRYTEQVYITRRKALERFGQIFMNSELIPPMVKVIREFFLMALLGEQFVEETHVWKSTTCFTDFVISMNNDFDRIYKLDTNFALLWIVWLVCLNSLYFVLGLRANILISGDAGRGKSYIFKVLEKMCPAGAIFSVSHQTTNAHNTGQGMMDTMEYHDEGKMDKFGMDRSGKVQHADPEFKQLLTDQIKTVFSFKMNNDGKRESEYTIARHTTSVAISTNEGHPHRNTPAMSRFIHYIVTDQHRADRVTTATTMDSDDSVPLSAKQAVRFSKILHYNYHYIVEKAIEAAVLPDVDMTLFDYASNIIFEELRREHIPLPAHRTISKFKFLCRSLTILYGVHMNYFSEIGREHRVDEEGNPKKFDFQSLMDMIKWNVCNQEIVIFVMTLLENEFCSVHDTSVIEGAKRDFKFPPSLEIMEKARFRRVETENSNETGRDYRYIEFTAENHLEIANRIKNHMHPKPSSEDIISTLAGLMSQFMEVCPKEVVVSKENKTFLNRCCGCKEKLPKRLDEKVKCDFCGRYRHNTCTDICDSKTRHFTNCIGREDCCQMCNHRILAIQQETSKCPQCKSLCHHQCLSVCNRQGCKTKTCGACKFICGECKISLHAGCIEGHKDLVENFSAPKDRIPAVIFDRFRTGKQNHSRISICLDMFYKNHKSLLRRAIKSSLEHNHMKDFSAITGFPYVDPKGVRSYMKGDTYYQVFDTIKFEKNPRRLHVLPNYFSCNPTQVVIQKAKLAEKDHDQFQGQYTDPGRILDMDMDQYFMNMHFKKQGIANDVSSVVIPYITKMTVWEMRDTLDCYKNIQDLVFTHDYPHWMVKSIREECKKREQLEIEARKGNASFAPASDLLFDKRRKTELTEQMQNYTSSVNLGVYKPVDDTKRLEAQSKKWEDYLKFEEKRKEAEKERLEKAAEEKKNKKKEKDEELRRVQLEAQSQNQPKSKPKAKPTPKSKKNYDHMEVEVEAE